MEKKGEKIEILKHFLRDWLIIILSLSRGRTL
jgi:hypothetical protein